MYEYRAVLVSVYDGDTITVDLDLGFGIWLKKQKIRLLGINTPELRGSDRQEGLRSRDALREKLHGASLMLATTKDKKGKYGRWLGTIYVGREDINKWLIDQGYAVAYL